MAKGRGPKQVELEYCFDRLASQKIAQAYRLLVSGDRVGVDDNESLIVVGGEKHNESRSHICPRLIGTPEGRADDRESGGGVARVCPG